MSNVENLKTPEKSLSQIAREEVNREKQDKGVKLLKDKYRDLDKAQTIVSNLEREIADLEKEIEQGNHA